MPPDSKKPKGDQSGKNKNADLEIKVWKLAPGKKRKPPTLEWQIIYPAPTSRKKAEPGRLPRDKIVFSTDQRLLDLTLEQEKLDDDNDTAGDATSKSDFIRSAEPKTGDLAIQVSLPVAIEEDKKTLGFVHHVPGSLLSATRMIAFCTDNTQKLQSWQCFEYSRKSKPELELLTDKSFKPKDLRRTIRDALVSQVTPGVGRLILCIQERPSSGAKPAPKKDDKGTQIASAKPPAQLAEPVYYHIFGRMRCKLLNADEFYDFGRLDRFDEDYTRNDLKQEIRQLKLKSLQFIPTKPSDADVKAEDYAVQAAELLETLLPDHESFASLVKANKDEKIRLIAEAKAKSQTLANFSGSEVAQYIISPEQIRLWDEKLEGQGPELEKGLQKAMGRLSPTDWVRLGTPSPEAGAYTPGYVISYVCCILASNEAKASGVGEASSGISGSVAGISGLATAGLETFSLVAEFSHLSYKLSKRSMRIEEIEADLANSSNRTETEIDKLKNERSRLEREIKDLDGELNITLLKGGGSIIATTKSIYDVVMTITEPSVDLAKDSLSSFLGAAGGAIGVIISAYVVATQSHAVRRTQRRLKAVNKVKSSYKKMKSGDPEFDAVMLQYMRYGSHKLRRKRGLHLGRIASAGLGGIGGVGGTVTGILVATGAVAATNAWNPIGWTIGGVGLLVGIGLSAYMISRRARKGKMQRKRAKTGKPVDKKQFVTTLVTAFVDEGFYDNNRRQWTEVHDVLKKLGALKNLDESSTGTFPGHDLDVNDAISIAMGKL